MASILDNAHGYWLKFPGVDSTSQCGVPFFTNSYELKEGWNMIGSPSVPADVSSSSEIISMSEPEGIIASKFFGYEGGYKIATTLTPGKGYWVKASEAGEVAIEASFDLGKPTVQYDAESLLRGLNILTVKDAANNQQTLYFSKQAGDVIVVKSYELPPVPPEGVFDARFSSQSIVTDGSENVVLSSAVYPVEIHWSIKTVGNYKLVIGSREISIKNTGSIKIQQQSQIGIKIGDSGSVPKEFYLSQNYPNPFNPTSMINFDLPKDSKVSLKVYDLLGRVVATLADNQEYEAGTQQVQFNAGNLASGMYFYRLTAQSEGKTFKDVKKMLLLK
jgi:hypothetical protein